MLGPRSSRVCTGITYWQHNLVVRLSGVSFVYVYVSYSYKGLAYLDRKIGKTI